MSIQHPRCPRCGGVLILRKGDIHICPEKMERNTPLKEKVDDQKSSSALKKPAPSSS